MTKRASKIDTSFDAFLKEQLKDKDFEKMYEREVRRLDIALKVIEAREKKKMTQQKMAKLLHTSQSAIARLESGGENITIDSLFKIAEALNKRLKVEFI